MDKQNVVYTHNGILLNLQKEILTPATTGMNLEATMLSEISQSQKDKSCMIPPSEVPRLIKSIETEVD